MTGLVLYLLPCHIERLILFLVQLFNCFQNFGFIVLNNPLLFSKIIVLKKIREYLNAIMILVENILLL